MNKETNLRFNEAERTALNNFAVQNGRNWKAKLRDDWFSSNPQICGILRAIRNSHGTRGLNGYKV